MSARFFDDVTMHIDTQSLHGLEYFTLLEHFAGYTRTPMGRELALAIRPSNDLDYIRKELRLVTEARILLDNGERPSLEELTDVNQLGRREYREAWAWVHFCLEGPAEARQELQSYLHDLAQQNATESFGRRL